MEDVEIEIGVPLPAGRRKYPFRELGVEESFLVRGGKAVILSNLANRYGKKLGRKYVVRTVDGGVRVWRVG